MQVVFYFPTGLDRNRNMYWSFIRFAAPNYYLVSHDFALRF